MDGVIAKLIMYRDELLVKKQNLIETNNLEAIEAEVAAYRESLIKADAEARDKAIEKVDSDINCIELLIAREQETIAIATATPAIDESVNV